MTGDYTYRLAAQASEQIAEADAWWRINRPAAPDAVCDAVDRALDDLTTFPETGARATNARLPGVRKVYLKRVRYHLFYRVHPARREIEVLSLWHASRGSGPDL